LYLQIHGARGSMPVGTSEFARHGGDTTCYSIHHDDGSVITIVDAGTGLRNILPDVPGNGGTYNIVTTHYHWDHIQGLSMCAPMWRRDIALRIFGLNDPARGIGDAITPPWFPVSIRDADVEFERSPDSFEINGVSVTSFPLHHPQGGLGYRFDFEGQAIVVATDHEAGTDADRVLVEVSQGADILVHDAQYVPEEIESKRGYGHSTWEQATKNAAEAGVGQLIFGSHDPRRSDDEVDRLVKLAEERFPHVAAAAPNQSFVPN
jgi:phosphoribosyl 1,2-cyclic phosphodiesterase